MTCDHCDAPARWVAFAAYETNSFTAHPMLARYPMPMVRACDNDLLPALERDSAAPGSTGGWLIQRIEGT